MERQEEKRTNDGNEKQRSGIKFILTYEEDRAGNIIRYDIESPDLPELGEWHLSRDENVLDMIAKKLERYREMNP